jgi:hypothetical protein
MTAHLQSSVVTGRRLMLTRFQEIESALKLVKGMPGRPSMLVLANALRVSPRLASVVFNCY